jgi:hypothetical protein
MGNAKSIWQRRALGVSEFRSPFAGLAWKKKRLTGAEEFQRLRHIKLQIGINFWRPGISEIAVSDA